MRRRSSPAIRPRLITRTRSESARISSRSSLISRIAGPARGGAAEHGVDEGAGRDVEPAGRRVGDEDGGHWRQARGRGPASAHCRRRGARASPTRRGASDGEAAMVAWRARHRSLARRPKRAIAAGADAGKGRDCRRPTGRRRGPRLDRSAGTKARPTARRCPDLGAGDVRRPQGGCVPDVGGSRPTSASASSC